MRRRASTNPASQPEQFLHPTLQAALESLDVELDEELTRYRRMRGRNIGQSDLKRRDRQPNTIVIGAAGGAGLAQSNSPYSLAAQAIAPQAAALDGVDNPFTEYVPPSDLSAFSSEAGQPLTEHYAGGLDSDHLEPDDYLASSEELLKSIAEEEELRVQEPGMLESLLTPLGIGSMVLLLLSSVTFGYLIMNPSSVSILGMDKLLGDRAAAPTQPNSSTSSTATAPDAVLPSPNLANQEFVDLNLDSLSTLPVEGSAASTPAATAANSITASGFSPGVDPQAVPVVPQAPAAPNLEQLPRVATASSTAPSRQRAIATQPRRSTPATRSTQTAPRAAAPTRATTPSRARPAAPAPVRAAAPASSPLPAPTVATAPATSPAQSNLYHVVTEYNGDRSLEQVRQVAGDAFLRNTNEGARVQAGAFSEQSRAQELVQDLQQQGIPARIEQPE